MLHLKYAPEDVSECIVNGNIINDLSKYLKSNETNTVCFIHGNIGSGKTLTTNLVIKNLKMHKTEINFTDKINKNFLFDKIQNTQNSIIVFEDSQFYYNDLIHTLNIYFKKKEIVKKIIIISDIEYKNIININVIYLETKITNMKLYINFIKKVSNKEKIKKKFILKHISKFSNNIRSCLLNLEDDSTLYTINDDNNIENTIHQLSKNINMEEKIKLLHNNNVNIQYAYYENIHLYNINIKTRLMFSKAMIFCDTMSTISYSTQNWLYVNYITFVSCVSTSNMLSSPPKYFSKSSIWSNYSNYCSKVNKVNLVLRNKNFLYSFKILKYIQASVLKYLQEENLNEIKKICIFYNIARVDLIDILHVGCIKKQIIKNIKCLNKLIV